MPVPRHEKSLKLVRVFADAVLLEEGSQRFVLIIHYASSAPNVTTIFPWKPPAS